MADRADVQVFEIGGVLRRYDWGSRELIPRLLGQEADGRPAAELWFGAHPGDPSPALGTTLDEVLAAAGEPPLPFLAKILAADTALSIQVHPNRAQARAGYEREEAAGIPRDASERNYVDPNHKPELLCALTPFDALCGFRPVAKTLRLLDELAVPELGFVAELLHGPDPLRSAFTAVLTCDDPARLVRAVLSADAPPAAVALAAEHFPDDIGVVLALLLNHVRLEPGQAIFLGAGNVHCYLRGMGVEVMASSDNVLRCGLTKKHIDVAELLAITDFSELADPVWPLEGGRFVVPVPDFTLQPLDLDGTVGTVSVDGSGPRIVLVTDGCARVGELELRPGHAALLRPGARPALRGAGQVFVVGTDLTDGGAGQGAQGDGVSLAPK